MCELVCVRGVKSTSFFFVGILYRILRIGRHNGIKYKAKHNALNNITIFFLQLYYQMFKFAEIKLSCIQMEIRVKNLFNIAFS